MWLRASLAGPQGVMAHVLVVYKLLPAQLSLPQLLLQDYQLPPNVNATTSAAEAIAGAQFAIHAVPVQHTRAFLEGIKARMGRLGPVQGCCVVALPPAACCLPFLQAAPPAGPSSLLQDLLPPSVPIISVSKGIEVASGQLMSEVIPSVLSKKHPTVYLSGGCPRSGGTDCWRG